MLVSAYFNVPPEGVKTLTKPSGETKRIYGDIKVLVKNLSYLQVQFPSRE